MYAILEAITDRHPELGAGINKHFHEVFGNKIKDMEMIKIRLEPIRNSYQGKIPKEFVYGTQEESGIPLFIYECTPDPIIDYYEPYLKLYRNSWTQPPRNNRNGRYEYLVPKKVLGYYDETKYSMRNAFKSEIRQNANKAKPYIIYSEDIEEEYERQLRVILKKIPYYIKI